MRQAEDYKTMPREEVLDLLQKYVTRARRDEGKGFRLKDFDPGDTCGLQIEKAEATDLLKAGTAWLAEEQDMLYAQDRWSLHSSSRRWTRPARTARSITSCRASIRRDAKSSRSSNPHWKKLATTSCGVTPDACPSVAASASSTVRTTRRSSSSASIPSSSNGRSCPSRSSPNGSGTSGSPTLRISSTTPPDRARKF